jgi:hypothetical protein
MQNDNNTWPFEAPLHKIDQRTIAQQAYDDGIYILYHFNRGDPRAGGYTIAYRKSTAHKSGYMVDVAVSYCAIGDTFSKKLGHTRAIENMRKGKFISVPALMYGEDELHDCLREMFTWA